MAKFRKSFVTNSSSSSFICEICGRVESGWDMGLSEAEMMECENGHTFCVDESLDIPDKKELVKMILENEWNREYIGSGQYKYMSETELEEYEEEDLFDKFCSDGGYYEVPECVCPICQFLEYSEYDLSAYLLKEYGIPREEVFEEVKKLNKRRKKLYENEYITHVCKKFDLNPAEIVESWKEKFGTYEQFHRYIKNI